LNATIYEEREFVALSSDRSLKASLRTAFPELAPEEVASLRYVPPPMGDRIWDLCRLVVPYGAADPAWQADPPVGIYTNDMWEEEAREAIAVLGLPENERIVVGLSHPSVTLEMTYCLLLRLLPHTAWIASPMDVSWMLYWHYGEFATLVRPRFDGVRAIELSESFRTRGGEVVRKMQYRVVRSDGSEWWSGALRDGKSKHAMQKFVGLIARLSGVPVKVVECFDEPPKR
jgi:hypothetical protein